MTPAAKSIVYFSIYMYLVGVTLMFIPNLFLKTIHLPETNEVWIRVVGMLVFLLAFHYHRSGAANTVSFFKLTIPARLFVLVSFIAFAVMGFVSTILIIFGVIDALGALWTWLALKKGS